jgi:antitoxin VapB
MMYINGTYHTRGIKMEIAKVFQTGRSQAVRLPKAFRFKCNEVAVKSFGRGVLLLPIDNPWDIMVEAVNEFEPGFQLERVDQGEQLREDFN